MQSTSSFDDNFLMKTPIRAADPLANRGCISVPVKISHSTPFDSAAHSLFGNSPWQSDSGHYFNTVMEEETNAVARTLDYLGLDDDYPPTSAFPAEPYEPMIAPGFNSRSPRFQVESNPSRLPHPISKPILYTENFIIEPITPVIISIDEESHIDQEAVTAAECGEKEIQTKSLWIGNVDPALTSNDLNRVFARYGKIDSLRILTDKECAFINFSRVEDAANAKSDMQGGRLGSCIIRIGFGKVESFNEARGLNGKAEATKSLCSTEPAELEALFSHYGRIESARVLTHKNCGFVNFVRVEDARNAYMALTGKEVKGAVMKINYAKVPTSKESTKPVRAQRPSLISDNTPPRSGAASSSSQMTTPASPITPSSIPKDSGVSTFASKAIRYRGMDSSPDSSFSETGIAYHNVPSELYVSIIPSLPEPNLHRKIDQSRLREIRKKLDSHCTIKEVENLFQECLSEAVDLSTDYIGNVIIQKLVEKSTDQNRLRLIEKLGPHLAAIGIHKNGTWAVQKIVDNAKTTSQIAQLVNSLRKLTPPLLNDQFGNYVVQGCLRMGSNRNQFIFDAMSSSCLEVGQSRFGSRAMRACLESQYASKRQQKLVATAIVQNAVQLCTNPNGSLLINWLLDTSELPCRYRVFAPKITPHIVNYSKNKLASVTLLKLVNQKSEMDARDHMINEIFFTPNLGQILLESSRGISLIQKILATGCNSPEEKSRISSRTQDVIREICPDASSQPGFKRLMDELAGVPDLRISIGQTIAGSNHESISPLKSKAPLNAWRRER